MNPLAIWIAKLLAVIIILGTSAWIFYAGLIRPTTKPNPSTQQLGAKDNYSYTIAPKQTFGCSTIIIPKGSEPAK